MSSAPSVPGVEVGAPWLGDCEHVLAAGALEMLAALDETFGPRRAELPESRGPRRRAGRGVLPGFLAGPEDARRGRWRLAPGLADRRVEITGPADRKMVINALNCAAKLFMADFADEPMAVARIRQVPGASVQGVPAGRHLADALDGPGHAGLAQHPDGRFGPAGLFTKEYVHARRLPAGL
jgi:malate synthase